MKKFLLALALATLASFSCVAQVFHINGATIGNESPLGWLKSDNTLAPLLRVNVTDDVILRAAEASGTIRFAAFGSDTALFSFNTATSDLTLNGDLLADGGLIGLTADPNLISMAANILTLNGDLRVEGQQIGIAADFDLLSLASGALTVNGTLDADSLTLDTALAVAEGGTGAATLLNGGVMLGSGVNAVTLLAVTTDGAIVIGDGATDPTTYNAFSSATGTLNISAGGTGQTAFDDLLGTSNQIVVAAGANTIVGGNATVSISVSPILPGDVTIEDDLVVGGGTISATGSVLTITDDLKVTAGSLQHRTSTELTIAAGVITVVGNTHTVDTESDAPTDTLSTINGGHEGMILVLRAADSARTVTVSDSSLLLAGNFSLNNTEDTITLYFTGGNWHQLSNSDNGT